MQFYCERGRLARNARQRVIRHCRVTLVPDPHLIGNWQSLGSVGGDRFRASRSLRARRPRSQQRAE